jgi:hypothetical protein
MSDQDTAQAQAQFRDLVAAHWAAVGDGDAKTADQQTEALNHLITHATGSGKTAAILVPLLAETEPPTVRVAAATYALKLGHEAEATPVLEDLAENDDIGLVAEDADLVLTAWRKTHTK